MLPLSEELQRTAATEAAWFPASPQDGCLEPRYVELKACLVAGEQRESEASGHASGEASCEAAGLALVAAAQAVEPRVPAEQQVRHRVEVAEDRGAAPMAPPPGLLPPPGVPSHGAVLHATGQCKPCAWFWKPEGCGNGRECLHCHLCRRGEPRARRRNKQFRLRGCSYAWGADHAQTLKEESSNSEAPVGDFRESHRSDCAETSTSSSLSLDEASSLAGSEFDGVCGEASDGAGGSETLGRGVASTDLVASAVIQQPTEQLLQFQQWQQWQHLQLQQHLLQMHQQVPPPGVFWPASGEAIWRPWSSPPQEFLDALSRLPPLAQASL